MMNFRSKIKFDTNSYILDIDLIGKARKYPLLSLNIKTLLLLAVIVTVLLVVSCSEKNKDNDIQTVYYSGIVKDYSDLDGCGYIIELENGEKINPVIINNSNIDLLDGENVDIVYEIIDTIATTCMVGQNAVVTFLNQNECDDILFMQEYDPIPRDTFEVNFAKIVENCIEINVSYGGGCEDHQFYLAKIEPWCGTPPVPPTTLELRHNANNDYCEAYLTHSVFFDLTPLQATDSTKLQLILITNLNDNYSKELTYNF
jgi:putative nigrescin immunity protein NigD